MAWISVILTWVLLHEIVQGVVLLKKLGPPDPDVPLGRAVTPEWGWIEQRLDHFNPLETRKWQMRYLNNSEFFQPGGPMIIYLGGEWTISAGRLMTGQVYDIASQHNGYMFYTEHRFYGYSYPTEDFTTDSLKYLSADQALADVAYFIETKKMEIAGLENSKVVVVGGSYSASLATWARLKYPHLVDAAYASSAPLRAVADFYEYYEVVHRNLKLASEACVAIIEEGVAATEEYLETEEGTAYVSELYNSCDNIRNDEPHRSFFFNTIAEVFAGLVQYAEVGQLATECARIENYEGTSVEKLASYVRNDLNGGCLGGYDDFLEVYADTNLTTRIYRQWFYQSCTEYGYFQTTKSDEQPFGDTYPLEMYTRICGDLFGEKFTTSVLSNVVDRTNVVYGGTDPELSNVISIHGTVDPWHALGLLVNKSETVVSVVVNGTAHCKDLSSYNENDIDEMKAAKLLVRELIARWISA